MKPPQRTPPVSSPRNLTKESGLPRDIQTLREWFALARAGKREGQSAGLSIITIRAVVDKRGNPIAYHVDGKKISPVSKAEALVEILKGMSE